MRTFILLLIALLALWRCSVLQGKYELEQSKHQKTQNALAEAVEKGNGWKAAYEEANGKAAAIGLTAQACLKREAAANEAVQERREILQAAQPRPRTATEQTQVVGNETRNRVALRLNRPL